MHHNTQVEHMMGVAPQLILAIPFLVALIIYIMAVLVSNQKYKQWPLYRTFLWVIGIVCAVMAIAGPLAKQAHVDFTVHMIGHLLLGMIAPLLMALAAPMTLLLRTLHVTSARKLTTLLKTRPVRTVTDPIVASLLNIGGLWILYTTNLYHAMHEQMGLHILIHAHVFLAGYVFTISMIYIDPTPHRTSYVYRSIVLIIALAGHGILSKYIYANPPDGVAASQAETGGMIMYYGGDVVDIIIIFILCLQWYRSTRPRTIHQSGYSIENL
jgi:putative membrane protein